MHQRDRQQQQSKRSSSHGATGDPSPEWSRRAHACAKQSRWWTTSQAHRKHESGGAGGSTVVTARRFSNDWLRRRDTSQTRQIHHVAGRARSYDSARVSGTLCPLHPDSIGYPKVWEDHFNSTTETRSIHSSNACPAIESHVAPPVFYSFKQNFLCNFLSSAKSRGSRALIFD